MSEEVTTTPQGAACVNCSQHQEEAQKNDEAGMAFLLALTPILALTFFGQVGLL